MYPIGSHSDWIRFPRQAKAGYRCFTSVKRFKNYIRKEILAAELQL